MLMLAIIKPIKQPMTIKSLFFNMTVPFNLNILYQISYMMAMVNMFIVRSIKKAVNDIIKLGKKITKR